jgi:hypothetical protein
VVVLQEVRRERVAQGVKAGVLEIAQALLADTT